VPSREMARCNVRLLGVKRTYDKEKFWGAATAMGAPTFVRLRPDALQKSKGRRSAKLG